MLLEILLSAVICCDSTPSRLIVSGAELAELALNHARSHEPAGVELRVHSIPADVPVPAGKREVNALAEPLSARGDRRWQRMEIRVDGRLINVVSIALRRSQLRMGWVYADDHGPTTPADQVQVHSAVVDIAKSADAAPEDFQPDGQMRLRRGVGSGDVVRSSDFERRPALARRSTVLVHGEGNGVRVSRPAVALEDAEAGREARVRVGERVLSARVSTSTETSAHAH
jgi:hypothetical protein